MAAGDRVFPASIVVCQVREDQLECEVVGLHLADLTLQDESGFDLDLKVLKLNKLNRVFCKYHKKF